MPLGLKVAHLVKGLEASERIRWVGEWALLLVYSTNRLLVTEVETRALNLLSKTSLFQIKSDSTSSKARLKKLIIRK